MAEQWQQQDTLRQMTCKFNNAIEELKNLSVQCGETSNNMKQLDTDITLKLTSVETSFNEKLESMEEENSNMLTSMEIDNNEIETNGDDPEISAPVKKYINERIQEIASQSGITTFGISSKTVAGVVRASDDVNVDEKTGSMSIPKLLNIGNLSELKTKNTTDIVSAINELYELLISLSN